MAGFSGGDKELPIGRHVADIVSGKETMGKDFNTQEPKPQYEFDAQVWVNGGWTTRKLWTAQNFSRPGTKPKFLTKLHKLTVACQRPVPQTAAEAAAWGPDELNNSRFLWVVDTDEETGEKVERFVKYVADVPQEPAPVVTAAPVAAPAAAYSDPALAPFAPEERELAGVGAGPSAPPTPRPDF